MTDKNYIHEATDGVPIKHWTRGVQLEDAAHEQLRNTAQMPFIHKHIAAMPDVHFGMGATIGSVIPTKGAIIPAAVGVDIGCGMMAIETSLLAKQLPDNLSEFRSAIEAAVPHGRTDNGGKNDRGAFEVISNEVSLIWAKGFHKSYVELCENHPKAKAFNTVNHLGTLGSGNHFIEMCLDERDHVWFMLHSGSRGVGNRIGMYFIQAAKKDMQRWFINLSDKDLAYIIEGSPLFSDYIKAVFWAQRFAEVNRQLMMDAVLASVRQLICFSTKEMMAVSCHHNYIARENHYDSNVWITRKGAVRARAGDMGIIPGSMGAKSFIVRGLGNPDSFNSCSHGAGRRMSRREAVKTFSLQQHAHATKGVECKKDASVLDETPGAYKDIDKVMKAQKDLVEIVHTLKQVVCVKG